MFAGIFLVIASVIQPTLPTQGTLYVGRCWINVVQGSTTLAQHGTVLAERLVFAGYVLIDNSKCNY